jgi:hypothetical protein
LTWEAPAGAYLFSSIAQELEMVAATAFLVVMAVCIAIVALAFIA